MRQAVGVIFVLGLGAVVTVAGVRESGSRPGADDRGDQARVTRGLRLAPVPLDLHGANRAQVGLGSYLVNAAGGCNDCHTCPSYAEGHDPFSGGDGEINAENYLAGGTPFGPGVTSRNLTPDEDGLPAGLTLREFFQAIRTGHDPDDPDHILQVMPWPVYRNLTDHDLAAIYAFLSAIPHAEPGCAPPE
jgi:cytochrome c553